MQNIVANAQLAQVLKQRRTTGELAQRIVEFALQSEPDAKVIEDACEQASELAMQLSFLNVPRLRVAPSARVGLVRRKAAS